MNRFLEPSTWAGLGVALSTVAAWVPGPAGLVLGMVAGAAGGVAMWLREKGRPPGEPGA
jgi:hypothetical protein